MSKKQCPFCDESQAYRFIFELEDIRVIYPKNPACQYHLLIVPKRHEQFIDKLDSLEWGQIHAALGSLVEAAKQHIGDFEGYNLQSNNGTSFVRQRVPHAHMHVFLRQKSELVDPLESKHSEKIRDFTTVEQSTIQEIQSWFSS